MKKRLVISVFLLVSLLLVACGAAKEALWEQAATVVTETPTLESPALTALLNRIRETVQPGTAGGSLRALIAAADLLDWAEAPPPQENIDATVSAWLAEQSADARALLPVQLESLRGAAAQLTGDYDSLASMMEDAGLSGRGPWSEASGRTAFALLDALER